MGIQVPVDSHLARSILWNFLGKKFHGSPKRWISASEEMATAESHNKHFPIIFKINYHDWTCNVYERDPLTWSQSYPIKFEFIYKNSIPIRRAIIELKIKNMPMLRAI